MLRKKPIILVVDDNPENLKVLGNILNEHNYSPGFAYNGMVVMDLLQKKQPDLILLDIMMHGMDGLEVCQRIKANKQFADIPIIFLTAKTETENVVEGLKLGAVDYITKPFNTQELLTRINTHLELQTTKNKLKEALAAKDKFFSIISHDLGNLFNILLGFSSVLANNDKLTAESKEKYINNILTTANKGFNLLSNLLEWSRSQTGQIQVNFISIDLHKMVQRNIELISEKAKLKQVQFNTNIGETTAFADINMLDIIIRNLLSNAVKFTPSQGQIEITTRKIENNFVEISVVDTGVGIPKEHVGKIFRIDANYTTQSTDNEKGNGLGLLLCKEFAEKNHGTIGVESEEGIGSRFYVQLPIDNIEDINS
ncbi:MAG: hybrid sensor histidine kinase/response regulator [Thiomargarita sp.]|nr:hybrid sensor histidine kinase/response regulator [Thiomargarita sp.]